VGGAWRQDFELALQGFVALVDQVDDGQWCLPALGEWDVRALVGHTSRALATISSYLDRQVDGPVVAGPVAYYLAALGTDPSDPRRRAVDAAIAARGRRAGDDLGADPRSAVRRLAEQARTDVRGSADERLVGTPVGPMTLAGYLPTRTFELTVHGLDLADAIGATVPAVLAAPIEAACLLAAGVAARRPQAASTLRILTGRLAPPGSSGGL